MGVKRGMRFHLLLLVLIFFLISSFLVVALPQGPGTLTAQTPERKAPLDPKTVAAYAGNVTGLTLVGETITQSWQGYFGNVSGTIVLDDASNRTLYDWQLANPEGEVYAANQSVTWTNVQCFNFSADGTFVDDSAQKGATSLYGMNLTLLEATYNIIADDVDGVDETFSFTNSHDLFYTNNLQFSSGECLSTNLYNDSETADSSQFQEALLYDPDNQMPVFTAIIEESSILGFNDQDNDFEMVVLEDGHGIDVLVTTYYFYVELE